MRRALLAIAAALLLVPATASASTVSIEGGVLEYDGAAAEANHVVLSYDWFHASYVLNDTGVASIAVAPKQACKAYSPQLVSCPYGSFNSIVVRLGNGGSYAESRLWITPVTMYAGSGGDTLIGGGGNDTLNGGAGHDTIACGGGADHAVVKPDDTVAADCEQVEGGATAPLPGTGSGSSSLPAAGDDSPAAAQTPPAGIPLPQVLTTPVSIDTAGRLPVHISCPAGIAGGCQGTLTLTLYLPGSSVHRASAARRRKAVVARSKFAVPTGTTAAVSVPLARRAVRIFRNVHGRRSTRRFKVNVALTTRTEAGTATSSRTLTVRAARRTPKRSTKHH